MSRIVFKSLFCVVNSFPPGSFFNLFVDLCQIIDAYVIIDLMTAKYIYLILKKMFSTWIQWFLIMSCFVSSFLFLLFCCVNFNSIWCLSAISTFLFEFLIWWWCFLCWSWFSYWICLFFETNESIYIFSIEKWCHVVWFTARRRRVFNLVSHNFFQWID